MPQWCHSSSSPLLLSSLLLSASPLFVLISSVWSGVSFAFRLDIRNVQSVFLGILPWLCHSSFALFFLLSVSLHMKSFYLHPTGKGNYAAHNTERRALFALNFYPIEASRTGQGTYWSQSTYLAQYLLRVFSLRSLECYFRVAETLVSLTSSLRETEKPFPRLLFWSQTELVCLNGGRQRWELPANQSSMPFFFFGSFYVFFSVIYFCSVLTLVVFSWFNLSLFGCTVVTAWDSPSSLVSVSSS